MCLGSPLLDKNGRNVHLPNAYEAPGPVQCVRQESLRTSLCDNIVATLQTRRRRCKEVQPPTYFRPLRSPFSPPFPTVRPLFPTFEVTTVKPVNGCPVTSFPLCPVHFLSLSLPLSPITHPITLLLGPNNFLPFRVMSVIGLSRK